MENIIINKKDETIEAEGIKIVGYDKTFGFCMDLESIRKIQEGHYKKQTLDYLEDLYYMVFVTGIENY